MIVCKKANAVFEKFKERALTVMKKFFGRRNGASLAIDNANLFS